MTDQVFVVMGTTGEYSDRTEWAVCAYESKDLATKHADLAMQWAHKYRGDEWYQACWDDTSDPCDPTEPGHATPYDPQFRSRSTGTDYYVIDVGMRVDIPDPTTEGR